MFFLKILAQTLGGLGLFVVGMKTMTDGLQMSAGHRIKKILCALSCNRVVGCATGTLVTAMVQSSSATTVMLIGFVSAGLLSLQQAVGVILGANVGTTMTSQLIAFKLSSLSLPAIALGVCLKFFARRKKLNYVGEVIFGFGMLFLGMETMKDGLAPLRSDPTFLSYFTRFDPSTAGGLLLCVVTGALLTVAVQSSSATVGLTMTLAAQGLLSFPAAMALVLGENIGTTITAELATLGTRNVDAHRAARAHTLFNVIGVAVMVAIFPYFVGFVETVTRWSGVGAVGTVVNNEAIHVARYIANGHTLFNLTNALLFLVFLPLLVRMAVAISPRQAEAKTLPQVPDFNDFFDQSPIAALTQVRTEIIRMAQAARQTLEQVVPSIKSRDPEALASFKIQEEHLDETRKEITRYLIRIYQLEINEEAALEIHGFFRMANNIEKIGDAVESLARLAEQMFEHKLVFSAQSIQDLEKMTARIIAFLDLVIQGMKNPEEDFMQQALKLETSINLLYGSMRTEKIHRLQQQGCAIEPGLWYIDIMAYLERIGGYCFNIAQAVTGNK
ncbi:Na/Pi cotransporter family protein [Desulfuromonas sp. CSMB_57]|uniref:Na/Pi cotransporter family protein n=1 Tax=Desulfuromonas sp. CSMB_57 TaxID=2807629 RepID=UPI001CD32088